LNAIYSIQLQGDLAAFFHVAGKALVAKTMANSLMVLATRVVEVLFFTGLIGCVFVVIISWVSIFKEGFSDRKNTAAE